MTRSPVVERGPQVAQRTDQQRPAQRVVAVGRIEQIADESHCRRTQGETDDVDDEQQHRGRHRAHSQAHQGLGLGEGGGLVEVAQKHRDHQEQQRQPGVVGDVDHEADGHQDRQCHGHHP